MALRRRTSRTGQRGFTLLELLMVVIIIGILSSMALPTYTRTVERARAAEALQILAVIRGAEIRARAQNDTYTTTLVNLDLTIPCTGATPPGCTWAYSVDGTTPGSNAVAVRQGPATSTWTGSSIRIDLGTGASCATDTVYGLAAC